MTFCFCTVAFLGKTIADTGEQLVTTINAYGNGGGTGGALYATYDDPTETVNVISTAPITGCTNQLILYIDSNITVKWTASLSGSRASSASAIVHLTGTGTFEVAGGQIVQTGAGRAIQNNSTGTLNISGGTVEVTAGTGHAIWNNSTGAVNVSGGTVGSLRTAIYNYSSGLVTISQANPSNPTLITSSNDDVGFAAIFLSNTDIGNTAARLIITGGTVENTNDTSTAITICNNSTGAVEILGGTVKAHGRGRAIYNAATTRGVIKISEIDPVNNPTLVTSACVTTNRGTIHLNTSAAGDTVLRLIIIGGRVENTANSENGRAIYSGSTCAVEISGGTVSATQGRAIYNGSSGVFTISEADPNTPTLVTSANPNASGATIFLLAVGTNTAARLIMTGGTVENTATAAGRTIYNASQGAVVISGGLVRAKTGYAVRFNNASADLTINGTATLFAWGDDIDSVINHSGSYSIDDDAVVIAWDEAAGETIYERTTDDDLISIPANSVMWENVYGKSGISYFNNANVGFIEVAEVTVSAPVIIPVTDIEDLPTSAFINVPLLLSGTVLPDSATYQFIDEWIIVNDGGTGAVLNVNGSVSFEATLEGTVSMEAVIYDGVDIGEDFVKSFTITVTDPDKIIPVTDITGLPTSAKKQEPITLQGTVVPSTATFQTIVWKITEAGGTGALLDNSGGFIAMNDGDVQLTATVVDGKGVGVDFVKPFTIKVGDVGIVETGRAASVRIYPNPTTGRFTIYDLRLDDVKIEIYDVVGQVVQSKIVDLQSEIEIDISHLAAGLYFLKVDNRVIKVVKE